MVFLLILFSWQMCQENKINKKTIKGYGMHAWKKGSKYVIPDDQGWLKLAAEP
jgi:hypothetical protein